MHGKTTIKIVVPNVAVRIIRRSVGESSLPLQINLLIMMDGIPTRLNFALLRRFLFRTGTIL
jgi:hypothetical protein